MPIMRRDIQGSAHFSPCKNYRWVLSRWWGTGPRALVLGANPSKAGWPENDPTVHRIVSLLYYKYDGFDLVNEWPLVSTDPRGVHQWMAHTDSNQVSSVLENNLSYIKDLSNRAAVRVVACGKLVPDLHKSDAVQAMSRNGKYPLYAFGLTNDGTPKHPMARGAHRIPDDAPFVVWRQSDAR